MNAPSFDEFLKGTADDVVQKRCEDLLSNPDTVVQCGETFGDDSLLSALKRGADEPHEMDELEQLTRKIEEMVPRHSISAEELNRVLDSPADPDSLGRIDRFRIIEFIASGGMGLVFRAIDPQLDREVCIKLLGPNHEFNVEAKSRFDREAREMARMSCERIVTVLEVGMQKGLPYFVMPFQQGITLRKLLDRESRISHDRAIRFTRQIASGLAYAHERGVLHRDIKPDNLWVTPEDDIKILDFGLARTEADESPITRSGTVIGTPSYMSPEQVTGRKMDARSDLFSCGVVLVEMLTGRSPFQRANLFSTLMSVAGDQLPLEELDPENRIPLSTRTVVTRLLQKSPEDRFDTADELIEALESPRQASTRSVLPREGSHGIPRLVAAMVAGFAICAATIFAWNLSDRGTLVVSTDDPSVKVQIEQETVSITDPVSGRSYEIRIGETALPSGFYQLELTDTESGLVFSSQQIAIRRGERTVVAVRLEPPVGAVASDDPANMPSVEAAPEWADPIRVAEAYSETGHAKIVETIDSLPSITLREAGLTSGDAISPMATIIRPVNLEDTSSWTAEFVDGNVSDLQPNADRSLWAVARNGFVRIYDENARLIALLPSPGNVLKLEWDSANPAMLVFSSYIENHKSKPVNGLPDPAAYRILVWLVDRHASRLVRTFETQTSSFAIDRSYRLVTFKNDALTLMRIDTGSTWSLPDSSRETLASTPVSPDGRYIATYDVPNDRSQISIWDLQQGRLCLAVRNAVRVKWATDSGRVAVMTRDPERPLKDGRAIEIWNVEENIKEREYKPDELDFSQSRCSISPDLKTIAVALGDSRILLTDTSTGRQSTIEPRAVLGDEIEGWMEIEWLNERELSVKYRLQTTIWRKRTEGLSGDFGRSTGVNEDLERLNSTRKPVFTINNVTPLDDGRIAVTGPITTSDVNRVREFHSLIIPSPDDMSQDYTRRTFSSYVRTGNRGNRLGNFFQQNPVFSPDGKFSLVLTESIGNRNRDDTKCLTVISHENDERSALKIAGFEWIRDVVWGSGGRYLIVSGREWWDGGSRDAAKVIDLADWQVETVDGISDESLNTAIPVKNGFAVLVAHRENNQWERRLFRLDTSSLTKPPCSLLIDTESLGSSGQNMTMKLIADRTIVSIIAPETANDQSQRSWILTEDFQLEPASVDFSSGSFSASGNYRLTTSYRNHLTPVSYSIVRSSDDESKLTFSGHNMENFVWHSSGDYAAWILDRRLTIFDPVSGSSRGEWIVDDARRIIPYGDGWLTWDGSRISLLKADGELQSQFAVAFDSDAGVPEPTPWIHADGRISAGDTGYMWSVFLDGSTYRLKPMKEFIDDNADVLLPANE